MKEVITINLSGRLISIEKDAANSLQDYLNSLRSHFKNEEGADEILGDIEYRIAELLQTMLSHTVAINIANVEEVKLKMGLAEELGDDDEPVKTHTTGPGNHRRLSRNSRDKMLGGVCSGMAAHFGIDVTIMRVIWIVLILTAGAGLLIYIALYFVLPETDEPIKADRKLFRDTENAWINGVCSGIAHYFKISPNIPRLVFAIPVITIVISSLGFWNHGNFHLVGFSFNGGLILAYVILSYVIPPARTDFDRMDMNGQAVNLESIKNNIKDQMGRAKTDIKNQAQKMGSSSNFGKEFGGKVTSVGSLIANILGSFISIVVFLVLLSVSLVLLVNYNKIDLSLHWIQASNWEKNMLIGALVTLSLSAILGLVRIFMRGDKMQPWRTSIMVASVICIFTAGTFATVFASSIATRYADYCEVKEDFTLSSPADEKLYFKALGDNSKVKHIHLFTQIKGIDITNDSLTYEGIDYHVYRSNDTAIKFVVAKCAFAAEHQGSYKYANELEFKPLVEGNNIYLPQYIKVRKPRLFQGQHMEVKVYIPRSIKAFDEIDEIGFWIPEGE